MGDDELDLPPLLDITIAVQRTVNASNELIARASRELGVNTTDMAALSLLEQYGPMGPAELANRLGIRTASVTALIDRLESVGHVERSSHPHDRRRVTVAPTPTAHRAALNFIRPTIIAIDEAGRALSPDARRIVQQYLAGVLQALETRPQ
uniref:MarR family winged helix-turn-helix transcriptional regulator n=1 Tax=Paractinoplanes polyasparticus TaxID=2856853 RepID=UPI001C8651BB|nr:MarR family transcriptional regulator [Actinoplanes polyasparticus]